MNIRKALFGVAPMSILSIDYCMLKFILSLLAFLVKWNIKLNNTYYLLTDGSSSFGIEDKLRNFPNMVSFSNDVPKIVLDCVE